MTRSAIIYIYIDDGLYTGKSAYKDLKNIISQLLPESQIYVFFIMAYSNGYKYWSQKIKELGQERNIEVTFDCHYKLYNDRNCKCECIDIVWPSKESAGISEVRDYENVIRKKGETHYLYYNDINENNSGMFSSFDGLKRIGEIFLKYGIDIVNKANSTKLRPLGFDNLNSFGFGSFCATDYNISNTCPLVLWWGSENGTIESDYPIECWYPLLPRRNNKELYREMIINSEAFSVFDYEDVLFTVYYLAKQRNIPKSKPKCSVSSVIDYADIDYDSEQYYEELFSSDLYQYLNSQKLFTIKVVQTAMYLGRDYNYENSMKRKNSYE
ncbi:MAG: hypothetical protein LUI14_08035 [Lachnospiraceae bacterium]|nr:hypothetical protein [Lachnospiraceae bacterium]